MKPVSIQRALLVLMSCLGILLISSREATTAGQDQDKPRKIVSDDFVKSRRPATHNRSKSRVGPKPHRTYRLASATAVGARPSWSANFRQLGITVWKLRPARNGDSDRRALIRERAQRVEWTAERVESDGTLHEGDYVRLSVESPRIGYLYVIDRDLSADGTTGEPMLIFPWSNADNKLAPGILIDIPGQEDDPNYFTARLTGGANQFGELLTFIVTDRPLDVPMSDKAVRIAPRDLDAWEKAWGGPTERYEMEGGAGQVWTREEKQAAANSRRRLTRDDPAPQTIYRVLTANKTGMLVNLILQYRK
jgi:hypothetical protein